MFAALDAELKNCKIEKIQVVSKLVPVSDIGLTDMQTQTVV